MYGATHSWWCMPEKKKKKSNRHLDLLVGITALAECGLMACYSTDRVRGLSVTIVSRAKAAESIVMEFGMWTRVGPRHHHVLDGSPAHHTRNGAATQSDSAGGRTCTMRMHIWRHLANTIEPSVCHDDGALCQ